ncbi:MAG: tRNA (adenosine(37)-N6)-dimethylallyltransferase MiaA [Corynebacterium sp.]|nr:tRNA (adenosine(37)-N6)-dimethylallyltransferase MiaA [Corynebacterium sp.]
MVAPSPRSPIAIVGPTAAGKTALSLAVCHHIEEDTECRAAVVNMDAMQQYRGMDIGTAKLSVDEREGIDHYLLDILEVTENASVAAYQRRAVACVEQLREDGVVPVLVGGSMLYYQSLIDTWEFPPTDPEIRRQLEAERDESGIDLLADRLRQLDPAAAATIDAHDERRIIRALEVIAVTGRPFTATQPDRTGEPRWGTTIIGLATSGDWLNPRIDERTRTMFEAGLVEETRALVARGLTADSTAGRAIGYAQVMAMDAGELTGDEAVTATIFGTRRYVRRQRAWFRRDGRIRWWNAEEVHSNPAEAARAAVAAARGDGVA